MKTYALLGVVVFIILTVFAVFTSLTVENAVIRDAEVGVDRMDVATSRGVICRFNSQACKRC